MVAAAEPGEQPGQQFAELVDVTNVPLAQILQAKGDSPIVRSIQRIQRDLDDPNAVLSAFSSFVTEL